MAAHSILGASGAERWLACPGSVRLLQLLQLDESDEPDYRTEGVAAHAAAAWCLQNDADAWEVVCTKHGDPGQELEITAELADPIQTYLDYCRSLTLQQRFIEYRVSSPRHPLMFGTLDYGGLGLTTGGLTIDVVDFKFGAGIPVDVEDNAQLKYYAFCLIDGIERQEQRELAPTNAVNLTIVQPRISYMEPVRTWETSVSTIKHWAEGVLIPAMKATELDDGLDAGPWCRFCPAKIVCPLLTAMFRAAATANPKHVEGMSMARLAQEYQAAKAVKMYVAAVEKEAFKQLSRGETHEALKLVRKKANRDWRPGAPEKIQALFGDAAMTEPELKSPAKIEKLPGGAAAVAEHAYTPDTGTTVALASDPGAAIRVPKPGERFNAQLHDQLAASVAATSGEKW
jgi:Protein of unknown function (DUF2800)